MTEKMGSRMVRVEVRTNVRIVDFRNKASNDGQYVKAKLSEAELDFDPDSEKFATAVRESLQRALCADEKVVLFSSTPVEEGSTGPQVLGIRLDAEDIKQLQIEGLFHSAA